MAVIVRRRLTGWVSERRRRWRGLTAALAALALGLVACSADQDPEAARSTESSTSPATVNATGGTESAAGGGSPTGTFTVEGKGLFIECTGQGEPTMILEVGEGQPRQALAAIADAYDSKMRVCSYDRANQGQSGSAPTPRTGRALVADLQGLLEAAEVPGPYLLVGHSAGGLLVQAYAATYPDEIAGVVVLNPVPPWKPWSTLGFKQMTPEERHGEEDYFAGKNGESLDYRDVSHQIARRPVPPGVPLHLLISTVAQCEGDGICVRTYPAYEKIMKGVSQRWPQGRFSQVEAPHEIHLADMSAVQAAIDDVLSRSASH
jgi:pimeloyl-ACP methyl ester carboxylesterase